MSNPAQRLAALRQEMTREGVDAYIVPRADEHLGEYVPACAERLAWISGFTGSAGVAVVLADRAAIFSDGRYALQLRAQTDPDLWERLHLLETPPPHWLAKAGRGLKVGYDPRLMTWHATGTFEDAGLACVALEENLVDRIWTDRPARSMAPLVRHELDVAGQPGDEKLSELGRTLREAGQDAAIVTDPASICWLFNVRGSDVPFTPFALAFAIVDAGGDADLFVDGRKVPAEIRSWLGNRVRLRAPEELGEALSGLGGKTVRHDDAGQPAWFRQRLIEGGALVVSGPDVCAVPKARKNATEQAGMRAAHLRDGAAVCRFLAFMAEAGPAASQTELSAAERLHAFRALAPEFRGDAFAAISAAGEHGAIIHYRATPQTDRAIRPDELYLIDSGGQYRDGTTDVTRTLWTGRSMPPREPKDRYTRVLKGLIAIATTVFPEGTAGVHLDALARTSLWKAGLDFDHGTGHGIGSYLSVHEGPASISRPLRAAALEAGMVMSDEPGYYLPERYGIRLENILLVTPAPELPGAGEKPFLAFETLTLAPFESRLLEYALLDDAELAWIDAYHARVLAELAPLLDPQTLSWLQRACEPLRLDLSLAIGTKEYPT